MRGIKRKWKKKPGIEEEFVTIDAGKWKRLNLGNRSKGESWMVKGSEVRVLCSVLSQIQLKPTQQNGQKHQEVVATIVFPPHFPFSSTQLLYILGFYFSAHIHHFWEFLLAHPKFFLHPINLMKCPLYPHSSFTFLLYLKSTQLGIFVFNSSSSRFLLFCSLNDVFRFGYILL